MAFKGQQRIVAHHAAAVVGDADQLAAAALHPDDDAVRAGVERILQQLLDHGCRPVDNLAGRDLVGHLIGKYVDAAHCLFTLTKPSREATVERNSARGRGPAREEAGD